MAPVPGSPYSPAPTTPTTPTTPPNSAPDPECDPAPPTLPMDRMSDLLLKAGLRASKPGSVVQEIAQARIITALRRLDSVRNGILLDFVRKSYPHGIDLSGDHLSGVDLHRADLSGAHLDGAHLDGADLSGVVLVNAILDNATLSGAGLSEADLSGPH